MERYKIKQLISIAVVFGIVGFLVGYGVGFKSGASYVLDVGLRILEIDGEFLERILLDYQGKVKILLDVANA